MSIRKLEREDWGGFCVRACRLLSGKQADVDVLSMQIGFQAEARRLPLIGMSYDSASDVLDLLIGTLSRPIRSPRELYVDEEPTGIISFEIIDAEGVRRIVILRDPLLLPAPRLSTI